ncbi:Isoquinoline 1-oxidoreductase beta subunit [hydrothermal vent metagenome]|uniref:Isoquinoline 1-oxidoreductase beta subunit n=1 Tax=hydrothermal vent metagenome TaxID=652676 RepID=A0A3B0T8G7_9ZZZZ
MTAPDSPKAINRRSFLKKSGWIAAGVTVTVLASYRVVRSALPALPAFNRPELEDALAWVQALPGGRIRFFCPRMEMGQGATLGLAQVVAEELNIDQPDIDCILPDTDQSAPFQMTVGSQSIANFFEPVSYGAARLREALRKLAAEKAGLDPDQVRDGRGGFVLPDGAAIGYGEIVPFEPVIITGEDAFKPDEALARHALRRKGKPRAIGASWKHPELEAIVTGQAVYSRDVSIPKMAYGQVVAPPAFGAQLQSADGRAAEALPGVVGVVIDKGENFVGVVTDDPLALSQAIAAIDTKWEMPQDLEQDDIEARLDVAAFRADDDFDHTIRSSGDLDTGRQTARFLATARYDTPFAAHAAMEPRSGLAHVQEDKVEVWSASQDPFFVQRRVAKITGHAIDDVVVRTHRLGGGFGGRVLCQAAEEAARLSAAVRRPVRVQWDRETEFSNNHVQPPFFHLIDAGVTAEGEISHWDHDFTSSSILSGILPQTLGAAVDMARPDGGTVRGVVPQYRMANRRIRYTGIRTPVFIGAWRGLGAAPNAFAIESMMDELAAEASIDPLDFRLKNLPPAGDRLAAVLREVAQIADWGRQTPPGTALGLASAVYDDKTAVAIVAEVQVDHTAQTIAVSQVWCAQDCGLVINPHQVENQIMGNIVWGCSMALKERITISAGRVGEDNFDTYEILRHQDAPDVTVSLVEPDNTPPVGVGESALAPVAPAIANAVFAATGKRVRRLPMSYEDVVPAARS